MDLQNLFSTRGLFIALHFFIVMKVSVSVFLVQGSTKEPVMQFQSESKNVNRLDPHTDHGVKGSETIF